MLSFYLKGLDAWQQKNYQRQAAAIRKQARDRSRPLTPSKESQAYALERAAFFCMIDSVLESTIKRLEAKKPGSLTRNELRVVKALAQRKIPSAVRLLQMHQINLPPKPMSRS
jgi:hypothetical protein